MNITRFAPLLTAAAQLALVAPAHAQSINIDFGTGSIPDASYGAAGLPGTWNAFDVLPGFQRFSLVGLNGQPVPADIYQFGGSSLLQSNDPGTSGNDAALIDDMLVSFNDPVDACVWFEGLEAGEYEVLIYALTPNSPFTRSRVRVDFADQGPVFVGGIWPGTHVEETTYARHTVNVSNGTLGLHSGLFNGNIQSGINGIQIRLIVDCAADFNGDGNLNSQDLFDFLAAFDAGNADFNGDGTTTSQDFFDYLSEFAAGC